MNAKFRLGDIEGGDVVGLGAPPASPTPPGLSAPSSPRNTSPGSNPTRRPQSRQKAASAPSRVPQHTTTPTPEPAAPRPRPGRPTNPHSDSDGTRPTNITVPVTIFNKLKTAREQKGVSTGELIAHAIESHLSELPELLAASDRPITPGGMFNTRARRLPRRGDEPERPITYRMTSQDLAVIDDLVDSLGARSRGHLITAALRAELDNTKDD